jgi:hypothetical protein
MPEIILPHKFTPRFYQKPVMKAILEDGIKRAVCVWHRRAGKDKTFTNILAPKMAERRGSYFYYFPTAQLGRQIMWEGMDGAGLPFLDHFPADFIRKVNNQEMRFETVTGSIFRIRGTDELNVVGTNPVGIVWSETSLQNPVAWEYVRPILAENGGWSIFNGTPRGKNWFHAMYRAAKNDPEWFAQLLTVDDTQAINAETLTKEKREMSDQLYRQEYYCDWSVGMPGAIYAQAINDAIEQGRICEEVEYREGFPVYTSWDIGAPVNTKVWFFQLIGDRINYLACESGGYDIKTASNWADVLRRKPYQYGAHFLPHDAEVNWLDSFKEAGVENCVIVPRRTPDPWGPINDVLSAFSRMRFNSIGCKDGLAALEAYRSREEKDGATIGNVPVHDWASHASEALSLGHQAMRAGLVRDRTAIPKRPNNGRPAVVHMGIRGDSNRRTKSILDEYRY